jgi:hypothetical protein
MFVGEAWDHLVILSNNLQPYPSVLNTAKIICPREKHPSLFCSSDSDGETTWCDVIKALFRRDAIESKHRFAVTQREADLVSWDGSFKNLFSLPYCKNRLECFSEVKVKRA